MLRYSPVAGERAAAVGANREAAAQYARALRFVDPEDLASRTDLLRRYSDACYLTDRCQEAIDAARELVACYRQAGDRFKEGETLCLESLLEMCPGSAVDAEPDGLRAVELLEEFPPGPELALAYANLAAIRMNLEDEAGARLWAERALAIARPLRRRDARGPRPELARDDGDAGVRAVAACGGRREPGAGPAGRPRCPPDPAGLLEHDLGGLAAPRLRAGRGAACRPAWSAAGSRTSTCGGS